MHKHKEIFGNDRYLWCGGGITGQAYVQMPQEVQFQCVQYIVYQLYLDKDKNIELNI